MTRTSWTMIRDTLATEISNRTLRPGDKLPTEPELAERFKAGRHSVRRAVEALAKSGKVSIEQGRGTFVEEAPLLTYSIGKRTRLRTNLLPQGCEVSGETLGSGVVKAAHGVANALEVANGTDVVESHRITLANGKPIAFGTSWYPADRFPDFAERREEIGSATETYKSYGIEDYLRRDTEMYARPAKPEEAKTLKQHPDLPVIVVRKVDTDTDGIPISHSKVIWASGRVKFTISGQDDG
ncbi:GntR family phosphonate transport system transcriptional regulator [Shimia isoporae]|uniref:GntR family phosphonate transport system transcriptional regulator n=2 Tax=Shimia isoporae TaxID=647720 RepID=A0A4R1NJT2_9RHOB|nr:GntR family phosphonate transport system transcriptional regulator [Shimia isoporae]